MAKIIANHCTLELAVINREKNGNWINITVSLTYHHNGQSVEFKIPWYGVTLEETELITFVQQAKEYLESPAPYTLSKEARTHLFQFSPMECGFSIKLRSYTHFESKKYTTFKFEMSLRDFGTSESVGYVVSLPTEEVLAFINEIEQEYEKIR
jgi:hypothetical protein